ncbi:NAD(P)/FAD-dependent oxidoreductase [Acuticoccus kandeliae]|uniref:NAD(P)/FAD-dependent oxidoreductase n=1 Tax=Acuticoccus kandeliae TaxID=2073160 RepID=UPI000D3E84F4
MKGAEHVRPKVVIVGAGFAGIEAARGLRRAAVDVTIIDRRNYHLFQPLLYQVATAALSPAEIAWPIRNLVAKQANARVILARVVGVDRASHTVQLEDGERIGYDVLILATGARHSYFGHPEWDEFAPGLKKIDDATHLRHRILSALEEAERTTDPARQRRLSTFVVVGGGPTGVEMAGAVAELVRGLRGEFRVLDVGASRVILVEAGDRILPAFRPNLSAAALGALKRLGIEVRLGAPVTDCTADGVVVGDEAIDAATVIWGAGVMASAAAGWLGVPSDRAGRVIVAPDLSVPGDGSIFVLGDTAHAAMEDGRPVPGVAPAAKQMGAYAARVIAARVAGEPAPKPFRYRDQGNLATIGRGAAVAEFGSLRFAGFPAWLLWAVVHVYFLIGTRNRLIVALNWFWTYVTDTRHARLIVDQTDHIDTAR